MRAASVVVTAFRNRELRKNPLSLQKKNELWRKIICLLTGFKSTRNGMKS